MASRVAFLTIATLRDDCGQQKSISTKSGDKKGKALPRRFLCAFVMTPFASQTTMEPRTVVC